MGFGTFFIGFFLLLNFAYFSITDIIAAAVMLLGLTKLSRLNRGFKASFIACVTFLIFASAEFAFGAFAMLVPEIESEWTISLVSVVRSLIICILTLTAFEGMREVSDEVGLTYLAKKCKIISYASLPVYILAIIAETPSFFTFANAYVAVAIGVISLLLTFVFLIVNLHTIYCCYAKICMPEDKDNEPRKNKAGSFSDAFKKQREERSREYAEYKLRKKQEKEKRTKK